MCYNRHMEKGFNAKQALQRQIEYRHADVNMYKKDNALSSSDTPDSNENYMNNVRYRKKTGKKNFLEQSRGYGYRPSSRLGEGGGSRGRNRSGNEVDAQDSKSRAGFHERLAQRDSSAAGQKLATSRASWQNISAKSFYNNDTRGGL